MSDLSLCFRRGRRLAHNRDPTTPSRGTARRPRLAPPGGWRCAPAAGRWSGQGLPGRAAGTLSQSEVEKSCARVDFRTAKSESPVPRRTFARRSGEVCPGGVPAGRFPGGGCAPAGEKNPVFFSFFPAAFAHV